MKFENIPNIFRKKDEEKDPQKLAEIENRQKALAEIRGYSAEIGLKEIDVPDEIILKYYDKHQEDFDSLLATIEIVKREKIKAWARLIINSIISIVEFAPLTPVGPDEIIAFFSRADWEVKKIKSILSKFIKLSPESEYAKIGKKADLTLFINDLATPKEALTPAVGIKTSTVSRFSGIVLPAYTIDTIFQGFADRRKFFVKLEGLKNQLEALDSFEEINAEKVFLPAETSTEEPSKDSRKGAPKFVPFSLD